MDSWVQVQVMVPLSQLGEFHEMHGQWLQGIPLLSSSRAGLPQPAHRPGRASWAEGSHEELVSDARDVYKGLSHGARQILDYLLDQPDNRATAAELTSELRLGSPNVVAGTLASFGFQCKAVNRELPFDWIPGPSGATVYEMDPEVVALFLNAREQLPRS